MLERVTNHKRIAYNSFLYQKCKYHRSWALYIRCTLVVCLNKLTIRSNERYFVIPWNRRIFWHNWFISERWTCGRQIVTSAKCYLHREIGYKQHIFFFIVNAISLRWYYMNKPVSIEYFSEIVINCSSKTYSWTIFISGNF